MCPGRQGLTGLLWDCETGTQHPRHQPASAPGLRTINTRRLSDRLNKADNQDGQDEEGQGAPLVQGGEGQGAKEVLRAHR